MSTFGIYAALPKGHEQTNGELEDWANCRLSFSPHIIRLGGKAKKRYGLVIPNYVVTLNHIHPRRENILIDYGALAHLCSYDNFENFQSANHSWIEAAISGDQIKRDESWTESLAVGNRSYIESVKKQLGGKAIGR